ncbi:MAG: hypothetical protein CL589_18325 [Alteromonadaceae bacterium]|nr:hypothetical protein [Alteromonadaceae bacterium]MAX44570.1 hypothetical protein [Alteromonadaceae bacterium]
MTGKYAVQGWRGSTRFRDGAEVRDSGMTGKYAVQGWRGSTRFRDDGKVRGSGMTGKYEIQRSRRYSRFRVTQEAVIQADVNTQRQPRMCRFT